MADDRTNPQKFHLSPTEIKEVIERGDASEMKGTTIESIECVLDLQIDRWNHLLADTAYLYSAGLLSAEYWEEGWERVAELGFPEDTGIEPIGNKEKEGWPSSLQNTSALMGKGLLVTSQRSFEDGFERFVAGFAADALPKL